MKKTNLVLKCLLLLVLLVSDVTTFAQKLPNIQQSSVYAPANIKIDGKTTEWNDKFQAYNHATDVFYTLSNDNDNLYLIIQATDNKIMGHIIGAGISLTINTADKKEDKGAMTITYPVFEKNAKPSISYKPDLQVIRVMNGTNRWETSSDSLINANNIKFAAKSKNIRVEGVKDIDTLISVYNEDGIKAVGYFNNNNYFTYELSVNLKHFGLSVTGQTKFAYHIKLNEVVEHGINITKDESGNITAIDVTKGAEGGFAPTDFWAEYTLAKK